MAAVTTAVIAGAGLAAGIHQGEKARSDQRAATRAQVAAGEDAIASQEAAAEQAQALAQPFTDFGTSQLPLLQQAITPVSQEQEFAQLQANPMFQAALEQGRQGIAGDLSIGGRIGSGDESAALSRNLILSASPIIQQMRGQRQQDVQNLFGATGIGQASAVGQAANTMNTATNIGNTQMGIGNVNAAGQIAGSNIRGQTINNTISQLPSLISSIQAARQPIAPIQGPLVGGIQNPNTYSGVV